MARETMKANSEQLRRVQELGKVAEGEELAPRGVSPFDTGAPPSPEDAKQGLERQRAAEALVSDQAALPSGTGIELDQAIAESLEKLPHEEWARRAGYLPQIWKNPAAYRKGRLRAVAPTPNPKHWIYAGALAHHQWPIGKEMTGAEFTAAVAKAHDFTIRA